MAPVGPRALLAAQGTGCRRLSCDWLSDSNIRALWVGIKHEEANVCIHTCANARLKARSDATSVRDEQSRMLAFGYDNDEFYFRVSKYFLGAAHSLPVIQVYIYLLKRAPKQSKCAMNGNM